MLQCYKGDSNLKTKRIVNMEASEERRVYFPSEQNKYSASFRIN